jgi:5-methylcytosine-specific restriction endonuclease McrA
VGWPHGTREAVHRRQNGVCAKCGEFVPVKEMILHHIVNQKDHGESTERNAEGRCGKCEKRCHEIHSDGNPYYWEVLDETQVESRRKRADRRSRKHRGQGRRSNHHRRR